MTFLKKYRKNVAAQNSQCDLKYFLTIFETIGDNLEILYH